MMMNPQQQQQQQQRQLVLAVEGTAALGPTWPLLLAEYVEKIVRAFCGFNVSGQKHTGTTGEMALIVYYSHGSHNGFLLQRTGWTSSMEVFFRWLSSISFMGGGFGEGAVAEGLAEALLMCCPGPNIPPVSQGRECQKHCLLIAASNPHRIPSPVTSAPVPNFIQSQGNNSDLQAEQWWLADADTVAQAFSSVLFYPSMLLLQYFIMIFLVIVLALEKPFVTVCRTAERLLALELGQSEFL